MTQDPSHAPSTLADYDSARSALLGGVVIGGLAMALSGGIATLCAWGVAMGLLAGRAPDLTSALMGAGCALTACLFGALALSSLRTLLPWQRVDARGVVAWATLGEAQRTWTRINKRYLFRLALQVTPADGPPLVWFFPVDLRPHHQPGARVVVRMDPQDRTAVLVDWDATRPLWGLPPASD